MQREVSMKLHIYIEVPKELSEQEEQEVVDEMIEYIESKGDWSIATQVHEHEQQII